jgi:general secretion pathway protein K
MLLIVVLILIGSIVATVTSVSEDTYVLDEYVNRTIEYEQIYMMADLALEAVEEIFRNDNPDVDYFGEYWSENITVPIENGQVTVTIVDQERFLNPNFLVDKKDKIDQRYFKIFQRLFFILDINETVLYNIIDWIDKNKISNGGIEIYPDFPAKNGKIDSLDELRLIQGINSQIFNGYVSQGQFRPGLRSVLSPYTNGKVNVNTASKWVLMSLDQDIDETLANAIISYRKSKPFKNLNDLNLVDGITGDIIHRISPVADVKSSNFLVNMDIKIGDRDYRLLFLIERLGKKIREKWRKVY